MSKKKAKRHQWVYKKTIQQQLTDLQQIAAADAKELSDMKHTLEHYFGKSRFPSAIFGVRFICKKLSEFMIEECETAEGLGLFGYHSLDGDDLGRPFGETNGQLVEILIAAKQSVTTSHTEDNRLWLPHYTNCHCRLCEALRAYEGAEIYKART